MAPSETGIISKHTNATWTRPGQTKKRTESTQSRPYVIFNLFTVGLSPSSPSSSILLLFFDPPPPDFFLLFFDEEDVFLTPSLLDAGPLYDDEGVAAWEGVVWEEDGAGESYYINTNINIILLSIETEQ